jgi:hypothetical protein
VPAEGIEGGLILPKIKGLGVVGIDAVARSAMEVETDMKVVLAAPVQDSVDLGQRLFLDLYTSFSSVQNL